MSRLLLVAVLSLTACKTAPEIVAEVVPPSLPKEEFEVVTQNLTHADVKYTGLIAAGSQPITVQKAVWEFVVEGAVRRSGDKPLNLTVAPGEQAEFTLAESINYVKDEEDLKAMDTRGGSLLLALRGNLIVSVPVPASGDTPASTKTLEVPFAKGREVRTPRLPHLKMMEFEAGRFSEVEVQALFHLGVVNPNPFQVSLTGIDYTVTLAGKEVAKRSIAAGERVMAASTGVFDLSSTLNEESHGKEAAKIVKGLNIPYEVKATLTAPLYTEELVSKGEIKLKPSK